MVRGLGWYYIEIDLETQLPTGNACSGYYSGDEPIEASPGCKWILVREVDLL